LLDRAVLKTIQNGGEVYVLDNVDLLQNNDQAIIAALYRF
jgi:hypothetical protein